MARRFNPGRRLASAYLLVQGGLGMAWWIVLLASLAARRSFQPSGYPLDFILTYFAPDMLIFVGGSLAASLFIARRSPAGLPLLWMTAGGTTYAAAHCVNIAVGAEGFWPATALMIASAACTLALACTLGRDPPELPTLPFKPTPEDRWKGIRRRLLMQIVVFWSVLLLAVPLGIAWLERALGMPPMHIPLHVWIGAVVFVVASMVNIWAAVTMLRVGRGTPLPSDCASHLVTVGPYATVRNPMAVAGAMQGMGVAILLESWLIPVYILIGCFLWHVSARPAEELDLGIRFGQQFADYRGRVRCWVPTMRKAPR